MDGDTIETDIRAAAEAIGEWSAENFGTEQPAHYPLLGVGEELGELSTSVLKQAQGIDDSEKYSDEVGADAERDAIGDVFIYLMDFAYRADVDFDEVEEYATSGVYRDELVVASEELDVEPPEMLTVFALYGSYKPVLDAHVHDSLPTARCVGSLIDMLRCFCDVRGYDFDDAVAETMDEVLDREWDADPGV